MRWGRLGGGGGMVYPRTPPEPRRTSALVGLSPGPCRARFLTPAVGTQKFAPGSPVGYFAHLSSSTVQPTARRYTPHQRRLKFLFEQRDLAGTRKRMGRTRKQMAGGRRQLAVGWWLTGSIRQPVLKKTVSVEAPLTDDGPGQNDITPSPCRIRIPSETHPYGCTPLASMWLHDLRIRVPTFMS